MASSNSPVVIVTGAAGGIGNAVVRILLESHGASVVATDIVEGPLTDQKEKYAGKLQVITGDIVDVREPSSDCPCNFCGSDSLTSQKSQNDA